MDSTDLLCPWCNDQTSLNQLLWTHQLKVLEYLSIVHKLHITMSLQVLAPHTVDGIHWEALEPLKVA